MGLMKLISMGGPYVAKDDEEDFWGQDKNVRRQRKLEKRERLAKTNRGRKTEKTLTPIT